MPRKPFSREELATLQEALAAPATLQAIFGLSFATHQAHAASAGAAVRRYAENNALLEFSKGERLRSEHLAAALTSDYENDRRQPTLVLEVVGGAKVHMSQAGGDSSTG